jgi:hypothetical protein
VDFELREEHTVRITENRMLIRTSGPKRDGYQDAGENYRTRNLLFTVFYYYGNKITRLMLFIVGIILNK